jgi:hypothetical protein
MKYFITILILTALLLSGCSKNVPLGGRSTFEDNGEPLTLGTIGFVSGNHQARSDIDAEGRYNLGFQKAGNGLPKGEYKIYIQAVRIERTLGPDRDGDGVEDIIGYKEIPLIADKYKSPETSGLTYTADGTGKTFDIQVERAGTGKR